jgi:hypothetical protein
MQVANEKVLRMYCRNACGLCGLSYDEAMSDPYRTIIRMWASDPFRPAGCALIHEGVEGILMWDLQGKY